MLGFFFYPCYFSRIFWGIYGFRVPTKQVKKSIDVFFCALLHLRFLKYANCLSASSTQRVAFAMSSGLYVVFLLALL